MLLIKLLIYIILLTCAFLKPADAEAITQQITSFDAEHLLLISLKDKGFPVNSSRFGVEEQNEMESDAPDFYVFNAFYDRPNRGYENDGFYYVNKKTAEVWEFGLCKQFRTRSVRHLQYIFREKYKLSKRIAGSISPDPNCPTLKIKSKSSRPHPR